MRFGNSKSRVSRKLTAIAVSAATLAGVIGATATAGEANAYRAQDFSVNSCGMPSGNALGAPTSKGRVKVQSWRRPGNTRTVILLDGMRAEYGTSGWFQQTNAWKLVNQGVNVVMPVGGPASFYTDWDAPSNFNGQRARYQWACVLNNRLVPYLRSNGFASKGGKYALMGISSGGNAALANAAQNRDKYYAAGSLSGYNYLTAPGMRTMLRIAMLDVAPSPWNVDSMWGAPWSPRWVQNDPAMLINRMQGLKLYVGSGNGLFGRYNYPQNIGDDLFKGTPLELLALTQAAAFNTMAIAQGLAPMTYTANGTHAWGYWQDMLWDAKRRGFFS
ncbi:MAG: alpha/beta hydrolase-fold protein [Gordonia sp. (in: high G+C Gram-positive bacteria)]|uniref:alpha/beta hydrolase-fold protein n=1 Tax=Gordonia sp. (in: high G+C Gram-positive bacteria) TaxID=84139 RepID=UPI003BB5CBC5